MADTDMDFDAGVATSFDTSFDVESEYKPEPLVIGGNYFGNIKDVKLDSEKSRIIFTIVLDGNDEVTCSDGETPVDGIEIDSSVWLPRPNDKNEMNKKGTMSKYQSKINMMKQFMDRTGLDISSFDAIKGHIDDADWIGIEVVGKVTVEVWEGRQFNRCDNFSKAPE